MSESEPDGIPPHDASPPTATTPDPLAMIRLLAASAALGVVVALGFEGFERASHRVRTLLWVDLIGESPAALATIALATVGGLVLGLTLRVVPGRGGAHPADSHTLIPPVEGRVVLVVSTLVVGCVSLVAGASLGPEGAIIPAAAGISLLTARWFRLPGAFPQLMPGVGVSALLAAMFGSPLAGVVPLLELAAGAAPAVPVVVILLPSLIASATAALTLQVLDVEASGFLPLGYVQFEVGYLFWAVLLGVICGAAGLIVVRILPLLRSVTRRTDARSVILTTTLGGLGLGILYAIGGNDVRFAGVPEILGLVAENPTFGAALAAVAIKALATAWCLATGYRGGKIFPIAYVGGAAGLVMHIMIDAIPLPVALGCGIAAALATGMGTPMTAALITAAVLGPELLPVGIVSVVVAHTVHLLSDQLADRPAMAAPAPGDTA